MGADLTLFVTYSRLTAESEAAMTAWRRLHDDTWFCRVGPGEPDDLPAGWRQMPPQPDAAAVGREAVGYGDGNWLLVVDAFDRPDPGQFRHLLDGLSRLDPRTIYLVPVPVSNRLVDVQPRLLHRTGMPGDESPAAELGLQMGLLPVWPLQGPAEGDAWVGIQDDNPLIAALARGENPPDEAIPDPDDPRLPFSLRLLLADDDRLHSELASAMAWLMPVLDQGPPAMQAMAGLIRRDQGRTGEALADLLAAWRAENLVQWPGYYPRAAVDKRQLADAIGRLYRDGGVHWAAALFEKLGRATGPDRERKLLLSALAEQAEKQNWDGLLPLIEALWGDGGQVRSWRQQLAAAEPVSTYAAAEIWQFLEAQGARGSRSLALLRQATRQHPQDLQGWQRLGSVALVREDWQEAADALGRVAAPEGPGWVWNSLGVAQVRLHRLIEAEASFRQALAGPEPEPSAERNLLELRRLMARQLRGTSS